MMVEGLNIFYLSPIALTLAFLTGAIGSKKDERFFKWFVGGAIFGIIALPVALFKRKRDAFELPDTVPALKKCPNCAEQLPLPALVCDACDYNFLSMKVGTRHKLLPAPSEPAAQDSSMSGTHRAHPEKDSVEVDYRLL